MLQPGTYVLSWWDQARDPATGVTPPTTAVPVDYVAAVYDASWNVLPNAFFGLPFVPSSSEAGASLWSARHTLTFTVAQPAAFHIAFGASVAGNGPGSVAIADVQLELAAAAGQPTTYTSTNQAGLSAAYNCPPTDSDLRAAFKHNCSGAACTYDLSVPLVIDTADVNADKTALGGVLAPGNYNYRHDTLALNLVGTGVHDCTNDPTNSCYGAGYVQYNMQHDATSAGILDYSGNVRVFDFGVASINGGKALAAEQYITMPVSSDDEALISQPGILHEELSGRPLDGSYSISIIDSPDLDWGALQDIQIVFNYEYWSAIQVSGNTADYKSRLKIGHKRTLPILKH
jgi:hypothetical protein